MGAPVVGGAVGEDCAGGLALPVARGSPRGARAFHVCPAPRPRLGGPACAPRTNSL
eukprot:CAMPEP_0179257148 /NCGR_PEP_ID=MMETSP0797-20121207/24637_1 /TAXON_ID=47934 /ORGANISM="Dinophysis acuminata, Strain DAEP01" /LENGTH=55 /DNA_ID=CAMNT_0020965113 /DNA_START=8 /DNA_END=175 /DNA_ORIENTATION=+